VKLPIDPKEPNFIHVLAHLEPRADERPGWDGQRLWPHPTYSTAAFELEKEQIRKERELAATSSGGKEEAVDVAGYETDAPTTENVSGSEDEDDEAFPDD